jgi:O-antigen/teichoic acid export membrane protein
MLSFALNLWKQLTHKFTCSSWATNTLWMLLSQGLKLVLQGTYFTIAVQALKPEQYGTFIAATALVEIVSPFSTLGAGDVMIKEVARDRASFPKYWGNALFLNFLSATILICALALVSPIVLPKDFPIEYIVIAAITNLIFGRLIDLSGNAYQSVSNLKRTAQLQIIPHILRAGAAIAMVQLVPNPKAIDWLIFGLISIGLAGILSVICVHLELGAPQFNWRVRKAELLEGSYFAVGLSAQSIYNDIDKTMLARLATLEATGFYAAAYRLLDMAFVPVRSLLASSYSRFFEAGKSGVRGSLTVAKTILPIMLGYSAIAAMGLMLCAPIVPIILGAEYGSTVEALRWLAPILVFRALQFIAADTLAGADLQSHRSAIQIAIAILNVGLNFWLIPKFSTAPWKGAMWSSLVSDSLLMVSLWSVVYWQYRCDPPSPLSKGEPEFKS